MRISLGWKKVNLEFGDGSLSCEIRPFLRDASLKASPFFADLQGELTRETLAQAQELGAEIFPDHVRNLGPLEDELGNELSLETVTRESKLGGLCLEILSQLALYSTLTREERGNLKEPVGTP